MKKRSRRRRLIPADELSRDFMLPVQDGYGILEQAIRAVKPAFYCFSAAFGCRGSN